ncbi:ABC transporter ATP-binding protein [Janthinobacterium sp. BJB304]|uniref:ABC transporter ATP-binding protein n=1 Tax=Janthinobacterium sp. BJB304 TaxID=1572871 RepID=UPI000C0F6395|nr:ABC transporter ATP-binding protein [Janthinobacterium sp. BJB304]PHV39216.1 macrolide ABC transporter ATP-binding protein [Janthinobacterium sp. BJB304]
MIKLRKLCVSYNSRELALDHFDLDIMQGERVAVMGPSGCGKSTLLSILGGLLRQQSGSYEFDGHDLRSFSPAQLAKFRGEQIGFVFQHFALLPHLTLQENLQVPIEHLNVSRREASYRALEMLSKVGIENLARRFPAEVSGGQAQRAAIARSIMRNPPVILADEPTGSLDDRSSSDVLELLNTLAADGTTLIVVTHNEAVADALSRTVRIDQGKIVGVATEARLSA